MVLMEQLNLFGTIAPTKQQVKTARHAARSGTFTDNLKLPIHRWFRYSAGFSAQWVELIIDDLKPQNVLDPFAGSGTTLISADTSNTISYGYESHPFIARVAQAKASWNQCESELIQLGRDVIKLAQKSIASSVEHVPKLLGQCYTPDALLKLFSIRDAFLKIAGHSHPQQSQLVWLAITSILRSCSFVGTAQWQYVLPNKRKSKTIDPFGAFDQKLSDMANDIIWMRESGGISRASVFAHDARTPSPDITQNSIDLVITSPPYPNNYDYADATRLEMTFWGEIKGWCDLQDVVRKYILHSCAQHTAAEKLTLPELLADRSVNAIRDELTNVCHQLEEIRHTKGGKKSYHTMIAAYYRDMSQVFQSLRVACKENSNLCFVIGDSAPYGIHAPADDWLARLAIAAGFKSTRFEKIRDRNIKWKNRKHTVPLQEGRLWIKG